MSPSGLRAPFPWFGGKRKVASLIWDRLGSPRQYIEPFFGSGAVLLASPSVASLEVVNDINGFLANFWRAVQSDHVEVARWADYPVSHIDLGARHRWLMEQRDTLGTALHDPNWPGDHKVAGWWLWGQCCWIGSGWCEWIGKVPHAGNAGGGVQALGQVPHAGNAGRGVQALGQVPHVSDARMGGFWTSSGITAKAWLGRVADRLERVRIVHGEWSRCLNHHYGGEQTAVFLDPPYRGFDAPYGTRPVADEVAEWAQDNAHLRVALCGHLGDYDLPEWDCVGWDRGMLTYGGNKTTDKEAIWFSPACCETRQAALF